MRKFLQSIVSVVAIAAFVLLPFSGNTAHAASANSTVSTTVQETMVFTAGNAALGNLTAGTPVTADATLSVTTNAQGGYSITADNANAAYTNVLQHTDTTTYIADKTAWNSATPNSAAWAGTGLGFRVKQTGTEASAYSSANWGASDAAATFAGVPANGATNNTIVNDTAFNAAARTILVQFQADVAATQKTGAYSGAVRFVATGNP